MADRNDPTASPWWGQPHLGRDHNTVDGLAPELQDTDEPDEVVESDECVECQRVFDEELPDADDWVGYHSPGFSGWMCPACAGDLLGTR